MVIFTNTSSKYFTNFYFCKIVVDISFLFLEIFFYYKSVKLCCKCKSGLSITCNVMIMFTTIRVYLDTAYY